MSESAPAFSFYAKDFMLGTVTMSLAERGAYITLLAYQWDNGSVPADQAALARICGCSSRDVGKLWVTVGVKFQRGEDGLFRNARLETERVKQADFRRRQAENGRLGGRPQKGLGSSEKTQAITQTESQTESQTEPKKSLSSSFPSSFPKEPERDTRASRSGAGTGLLKPHGQCAFDSLRVWVPWKLHYQLVGLRNNPNAQQELDAFYQRVSDAWTTGPYADADVDPEMFDFWRARYKEQWPPTKPDVDPRLAAQDRDFAAAKTKYGKPRAEAAK